MYITFDANIINRTFPSKRLNYLHGGFDEIRAYVRLKHLIFFILQNVGLPVFDENKAVV